MRQNDITDRFGNIVFIVYLYNIHIRGSIREYMIYNIKGGCRLYRCVTTKYIYTVKNIYVKLC